MFSKSAVLMLFLAGALWAQRIELLISELGGRAARDAAGQWIVAQSVSKPGSTDRDIHVRKLTEDPPGFDITIGGSGNDDRRRGSAVRRRAGAAALQKFDAD